MWALIFFILLLLIFKELLKKPPSYPPGPPLIPFLGNLLSVWINLRKFKCRHSLWQNWSHKYGNILGLRLGFVNVIIVFGKDFIREVSTTDVFDGRPSGLFYLMRSFGKKLGIVFSDGQTWSKTRRMVLKCLKNCGYSSRSMENTISIECKALVELRMGDGGKPVVINHMFDVSVVNILWKLVAGKRYDLKDKQLKALCELITRTFKVGDMSGGILNFLPFLRHIMPNLIGYTEMEIIHKQIYEFLNSGLEVDVYKNQEKLVIPPKTSACKILRRRDHIARTVICQKVIRYHVGPSLLHLQITWANILREHQATIDVKNPRDVIDMLLIEIMDQQKETFSYEELQVICLDLLEAGVETVSNTAVFMLLYIVRNQEIQKNLQREIDEEIGHSRQPTLSDRSRMIYTEAVLLETLRISSVAAVGIPHMALEDTKLGNYVIPKNTLILLAIHDLHNGGHWKEAESFKPERFLTKEGNIIQDEWLMPFGSGRRRCIGEGLARSELFMFLTHLLQRFNLKLPDGDPLPSTDPIDGVTLSAKDFRIIFEPRSKFH